MTYETSNELFFFVLKGNNSLSGPSLNLEEAWA